MNFTSLLARASLLLAVAGATACGAPDDATPLDCGSNPLHQNDVLRGVVLQLEAPDACVKLTRRDIGEPDAIYKAYPWALEQMVVAYAGQEDGVRVLDDEGDLTWTSTHHNWDDEAAGADGALRYRVALPYGPTDDDGAYGYAFELHVEDDAGAVVAGPFALDG